MTQVGRPHASKFCQQRSTSERNDSEWYQIESKRVWKMDEEVYDNALGLK